MLKAVDQYSGGGGSTKGALYVPGVEALFGANHYEPAHNTWSTNNPRATHWLGDVQKEDAITNFPYGEIFLSSPACPRFSNARGEKQFFDKENQLALWAEDLTEDQRAGIRSRALMEEVVTYLRHCQDTYGKPVLGFMVENVVQARKWAHWERWTRELRKLGYTGLRYFPLNAMHVQPVRALPSMQSRNRLIVAGVHDSVGRQPDWDKWLRPLAYCPRHDGVIQALLTFKKFGQDMGVYGVKTGQYVYRCPRLDCGGQIIEPSTLPAAECIDWTDLGTPIGDRPKTEDKPDGLEPNSIDRIEAGVRKHWVEPFLAHVGGSWNTDPYPVTDPIKTVTTRENTGLVVPVEGRPGKQATSVAEPLRTQTTRRETGIAFPGELPSLMLPMRGGGDKLRARLADVDPLHAVTAGGNHHGLVVPPGFVMRNNGSRGDGREQCTSTDEPVRTITTTGHQSLVTLPEPLVMSYYGKGSVRPVSEPIGTFPTKDRWGLLTSDGRINIDKIRFRMLKVPEIQRAMSFPPDYVLTPRDQRTKVKLLGNAVPPLMAEVVVSLIVEAITGEPLERAA